MGAYNVRYKPWIAIKEQVLVDFVAEFAEGVPEEENVVMSLVGHSCPLVESLYRWNFQSKVG